MFWGFLWYSVVCVRSCPRMTGCSLVVPVCALPAVCWMFPLLSGAVLGLILGCWCVMCLEIWLRRRCDVYLRLWGVVVAAFFNRSQRLTKTIVPAKWITATGNHVSVQTNVQWTIQCAQPLTQVQHSLNLKLLINAVVSIKLIRHNLIVTWPSLRFFWFYRLFNCFDWQLSAPFFRVKPGGCVKY